MVQRRMTLLPRYLAEGFCIAFTGKREPERKRPRVHQLWLVASVVFAGAPATKGEQAMRAADAALWAKATETHEVLWHDFICPRTFQIYTYLDPKTRRVVLPAPADIAALKPSTGGWGTAIENCSLDGGA